MTTGVLLLFLIFSPAFISGNDADLAAFFRSQSIPVTAVENREDVVVVKANFPLTGNPDLEQLQPMLSTIFSKAAQTFPDSSRIQVDYSIENELIASLSMDTNTLLDAGGTGGVDERDSIPYAGVKIEATDRTLTTIHEGWDVVEDEAGEGVETEEPLESGELADRDKEQDKQREKQKAQEGQGEQEISGRIEDAGDGLTAYVGAVFARHEGEGIKLLGVLGDTPAQNTGLQEGDIILEVEDMSFRDRGSQPEVFAEMMQKMPPDKPLRFHILREGKSFDVWIKPLRINEEQLAAFQTEIREKFSSDYSRGSRLMDEKNYGGAIEYFQRSLKSNNRIMESYQGLGICCFHLGEHKQARKYLENAIKMDKTQPLSWFYGALNMDALKRKNGAMDGYKRYLKLNHDNEEMNAFARERLEQLKRGRRLDWSKRLLDVIEAIKKEIKD
jgi:hypothetical protein